MITKINKRQIDRSLIKGTKDIINKHSVCNIETICLLKDDIETQHFHSFRDRVSFV